MRRRHVSVLLVLLVGIFLFCDIALNYIGALQSGRQVFLVWVGIVAAQPALLAIWAVFGSETLFLRLPKTVFLVSLVSLSVTLGTWLNLAGQLNEDSLGVILSPFCQFTFLFILLWPIRFFRNSRIVGAMPVEGTDSNLNNRFSLIRLFAWQTLMAAGLFAGLFLFRDSWIDRSQGFPFGKLGEGAAVGAMLCFFSLPIVFLVGAIMDREIQFRRLLGTLIPACLVWGVALLVLYIVQGKLSTDDSGEVLMVVVSFHLTSLVSLLVLREMGYRVKRLDDRESVFENVDVPNVEPISTRRFLVIAGTLVLLLLAMCPYAAALREQRLSRAEEQKWLNLGIRASHSDDGTFRDVSFLVRKPILDEALAALANCPQLRSVNLGGTRILDNDLRLVGKLTQVDTLALNDTKVTNAGLQHLSGMQRLRFVHLQRCPGVTARGVNELQAALPNCQIVFP